jgi:hypothetical protein
VTVSERNNDRNKDDLFWALCGAGGGNFGVVIEMKLALQQLKSKFVVAGRYTWHPEKDDASMEGFMITMNSFYTRNWSNEMTIDSSWLCNLKETKANKSDIGVRFLVYYNGRRKDFDQEINKWTLPNNPSHGHLKGQLITRSLEEPSSRFLHETLAAQWVEETKKALIREQMQKFKKKFAGETGLMQVTFIHSGGAANCGFLLATVCLLRIHNAPVG